MGCLSMGGDFSRGTFVADAAAFIEALELAPALVVGHSLGGARRTNWRRGGLNWCGRW
jgi:pimeloyl-ACP methyl ester carboxylesterase